MLTITSPGYSPGVPDSPVEIVKGINSRRHVLIADAIGISCCLSYPCPRGNSCFKRSKAHPRNSNVADRSFSRYPAFTLTSWHFGDLGIPLYLASENAIAIVMRPATRIDIGVPSSRSKYWV